MQDVIYFINQNIFLVIGWCVVSILLLALEVKIRKFGPKKLSVSELVEFINQRNAVLYDLRSHADFNKGHISQAINFQFSEINDTKVLLKKLELQKEHPIVLICKDGVKSSQEAFKLLKADIKQVGYLNGGMMTWLSEGLPTVSS